MLSVHFAHFSASFLGAAPTPYVQVAILNLPHPYLKSTTAFLDIVVSWVSVLGALPKVLSALALLLRSNRDWI